MSDLTLRPVQPGAMTQTQGGAGISKTSGTGFADILQKTVSAANSEAVEADRLAEGLALGQHANIHETMIAMEKAGISFRLMTKVQQKVIDSYREIMRMQL